MDRFEYANSSKRPTDEFVIVELPAIGRLYDGPDKTQFTGGQLTLTNHDLLWSPERSNGQLTSVSLSVPLVAVRSIDVEKTSSLFGGVKSKLLLTMHDLQRLDATHQRGPGPVPQSAHNVVKIAYSDGDAAEQFVVKFRHWLKAMAAAPQSTTTTATTAQPAARPPAALRSGIVGIERTIQQRQQTTDATISVAFQDLSKLMALAKDMCAVSQAISAKVVQRTGEISSDETVRLKAQLLSMGIDNPVLRDHVRDDNEYHVCLAQEITAVLLQPLIDAGGMMPMAEVFCRVNRARALAMVSPDDVLKACDLMHQLGNGGGGTAAGAMRLRRFEASGTIVLQLEQLDDEFVALEIVKLMSGSSSSLSVEELAREQRISVQLAQVRLLAAEQLAIVCRDESIEGLRFYPNRFMSDTTA